MSVLFCYLRTDSSVILNFDQCLNYLPYMTTLMPLLTTPSFFSLAEYSFIWQIFISPALQLHNFFIIYSAFKSFPM